jgi:hypothetical protein
MKTKNLLLATVFGFTTLISFAQQPSKVWAQITDANGCTATAQVVLVDNSVSGIGEENSAALSVYPYPSNGTNQVTWNGNMTEMSVVDQNGREIVRENIEGTKAFSLQGLSVGTYFV